MTILVTGVAGFIGHHVARSLLERGDGVLGIDDLNPYYGVALKQARLRELEPFGSAFRFRHADIADADALRTATSGERLERIVHLAAQPGVRHSLEAPHAYGRSNLTGHLNMLELARAADGLEIMLYASSSSVYGRSGKAAFAETDRVDEPLSLYAATKRAGELMSESYAYLFGLPLTGLRFFTVYGPWGRPDMAVWGFTEKILRGLPIILYDGRLERDFTYIDDIVSGVLAVLDRPGEGHHLYNIGNNRPQEVRALVALIEAAAGRKAQIEVRPRPPTDVARTAADIGAIGRDHGWAPTTTLEEGVPRFVDWYRGVWLPREARTS